MNNRLLVTYKIINFVWIATPRWQLLQNKLKNYLVSNHSILSVPDESYSRNVWCALN